MSQQVQSTSVDLREHLIKAENLSAEQQWQNWIKSKQLNFQYKSNEDQPISLAQNQDRFINNRKQSNFNMFQIKEDQENCNSSFLESSSTSAEICNKQLSNLYKAAILDIKQPQNITKTAKNAFFPFKNGNMLQFSIPNSEKQKADQLNALSLKMLHIDSDLYNSFNLGVNRKIPKAPLKVLDAPALQDDFYLNLVDWSHQDMLAVGLSSSVYLWSASSSKVTKLCDLGRVNEVTSVSWSIRNQNLAVGRNDGTVEVWDCVKKERIRVMIGHSQRVGALSWSDDSLTSGSRDKSIFLRDLRSRGSFEHKLVGHKQEVCGLKWSFDHQQLASGGNDNTLLLWNSRSIKPVAKFSAHTAAVKALAWSPHTHGLLASGGGTQDRRIRLWNTLKGVEEGGIETGSQVCNLMFSKTTNELVSTHGYSQNQIALWSVPDMEKLAVLSGHSYRVLYLAMNPDGSTIVTGAGDETLRFWNLFPSSRDLNRENNKPSLLSTKNIFMR